jgi:predicted nucleic acid-binding protein
MPKIVLLDSTPLGLLTARRGKTTTQECLRWLSKLRSEDVRIILPEITDYELRRELVRLRKTQAVARLDMLATTIEYLPLTTSAMRRAADLWATARQRGRPTAADDTIDGDMILCAQALELGEPDYVIATTNVGHLGLFCRAETWTNITV